MGLAWLTGLVVSTHEFLGPCYIQADPANEAYFWYNHRIDRIAYNELADDDNALYILSQVFLPKGRPTSLVESHWNIGAAGVPFSSWLPCVYITTLLRFILVRTMVKWFFIVFPA